MSEQQATGRAKYTTGPWRAERVFAIDGDMDIENWRIIAGERNSIAYTAQSNTSVSSEENLANARLIASAPDLLRELLNGHVSPGGDEVPETQHPLSYTLDCIAEDIAGTDEGDWWSDWLRNKAKEIENAIAKAEGTTK